MIEKFTEYLFGKNVGLRGILPVRKTRFKSKNGGGRCESFEKTKLSLHPTFFLVGILYSFTGELPFFLMTTLVALEHELAHAFAAARLGYRLNKICLMPYGAVIDGDLKGVSLKDEIAVAISGPLCNLFTAAGFAALWWFFPVTYAYTDIACFLSLSIALVNFLPAYPLDGGPVLNCALTLFFLNKKGLRNRQPNAERLAERVCIAVTFLISACLVLGFFALWQRGEPNYTILGFTFFLIVGCFGSKEDARYLKIGYSNLSSLKNGVEIRRVAILASAPLKSALRYLCRGKYLVLEVYDDKEQRIGEIRQSEFSKCFQESSIYAPIGVILSKRI